MSLHHKAPAGWIGVLSAAAFVLHVLAHQIVVTAARLTTSYRSVELHLSDLWLGTIAAGFSLLPLLIAMAAGTAIDRNGARLAFVSGAVCTLLSACGLFLLGSSIAGLLACNVLLGLGHLLCLLSQHAITANQESVDRDRLFGRYTAMVSLGQVVSPLFIALFGGEGTVPDTNRLFAFTAVLSLASFVFVLAVRGRASLPQKETYVSVPIRGVFKYKGVMAAIIAGVGVMCAIDVLVIYLPVLGTEADIPAGIIAVMLTLRALMSLLSRLFFGWCIERSGRRFLLTVSIGATALGLALPAIATDPWALAPAMILIGLGVGFATPLTLSWMTGVVPPRTRALALSLRLTANRLAQFLLPMAAGLMATSAGVTAIFIMLAIGMAAVTIVCYRASQQ